MRYVWATFQALADAILPPVCRSAGMAEEIRVPGGIELGVDRYLAGVLDHSQFIPEDMSRPLPVLSLSTAILLDAGAVEWMRRGRLLAPPAYGSFPGGGPFTVLSREDRLQTLVLLDRKEVPLSRLPLPYTDQPALVETMADSLNQLPMFDYFADSRTWGQTGYPGPSFGYRCWRGGAGLRSGRQRRGVECVTRMSSS
ncbi:hypothetical protein [Gorillibacterium sp. sgz5001074]|uniref:hypothetical protein n=1 Tax=Gorillibacterium sp. sgz5001074 TaxID=3446695 RepID=UPI003F675380